MERHDHEYQLVEAPQGTHRDHYVRMRAPKAGRSRSNNQKPNYFPGGIRQRRNKRWNW